MKLYRCDWNNGDVSLVWAEDESDAIFVLDEEGEASLDMLTEIAESGALHLFPISDPEQEDGEDLATWKLEHASEAWSDGGPLSLDFAKERLLMRSQALADCLVERRKNSN